MRRPSNGGRESALGVFIHTHLIHSPKQLMAGEEGGRNESN